MQAKYSNVSYFQIVMKEAKIRLKIGKRRSFQQKAEGRDRMKEVQKLRSWEAEKEGTLTCVDWVD